MVLEKDIIIEEENKTVKQSIFIKKRNMCYKNDNFYTEMKDIYINTYDVRIYYKKNNVILLIFNNYLRIYFENDNFYTVDDNIKKYYAVKNIYITVNNLLGYDIIKKPDNSVEYLSEYGNNIFIKFDNKNNYYNINNIIRHHEIIKYQINKKYCLKNGRIKRLSVEYFIKLIVANEKYRGKMNNGVMMIYKDKLKQIKLREDAKRLIV